jgi:uncharacterized membrane protein
MGSLFSPDDTAILWALIAGGTALAIWLEQTYRWAARLSGPVLGLLIAMILTNIGVMPGQSPAYDFVGDWLVPLAIPLLLFRANLREILRTGGRTFLIFHLSAVGTVLGTVLAVVALRGLMGEPETVQAAGMMTASYMGGGVNFMAVKTSYGMDEGVAGPLIVADNFVMATMFVVMLGMAASRWFRARYPHPHSQDTDSEAAANLAAQHWSRKGVSLLDVAKSFAFAFAVLAFATFIRNRLASVIGDVSGRPLPVQILQTIVTNQFVLITLVTLALATSLAKPLSKINGPEEFGAYLLYVFLFTLGLPANLLSVLKDAPLFFVFCAIIAVVNLVVTLGVGRLLRLNLEELLLVVNANLGGPPSAAAMAISAGWPRLVLPALLVGIWGYVIGTPVGILVVEILSR